MCLAIFTAYAAAVQKKSNRQMLHTDVMKQLEKDGLVIVEMDEQKTMLIKLL